MTKIYCDGSGWSGTSAAFCVTMGKKKIVEVYYEPYTNNQMEYAAVLRGMTEAHPGQTIYTDSKLVVGQIHEGWKCNVDKIRQLMEAAKCLVRIKNVKVEWVPRNKNVAGWALEERLKKIHKQAKSTVNPKIKLSKKEKKEKYARK